MFFDELETTVPSDHRTCFINVDSYENRQMKGIMYNPYYKCSKAYLSLSEVVVLMSRFLDELLGPSEDSRSFGKRDEICNEWSGEKKLSTEEHGRLATFKIDVLFRQNASWQGVIYWVEESREECFRSVLELILLIDSALTAAMGKQTLGT